MAAAVTYEPSAEDVYAAARAIARAHLAPEARRPARILFGERAWQKLMQATYPDGDPTDDTPRPAGTPPPPPPASGVLYGIPAALDEGMQPYGWLVLDENGGTCGAGLVGA